MKNSLLRFLKYRTYVLLHVTDFDTLVPAPELSLTDTKNNPFRNMTTQLHRERQLWSGNESVEIRYVSGSSVAGTSALSPGVPRQILHKCFGLKQKKTSSDIVNLSTFMDKKYIS